MNLTLTDVTFDSNSAIDGGAIWLESGAVDGTGVTFSNNMTTDGLGSAVLIDGGRLTLTNSTIANGNSGGIENTNSDSLLTLNNVTMNGNAQEDLDSVAGTESSNTIFGDGCGSETNVNSDSGNVDPTDTCNGLDQGDDQGDPAGLGALADNGGPTETEALLSTSPAIDLGFGCPPEDQRHYLRGDSCDSGAYAAGVQLAGTAGVALTADLSDQGCPAEASVSVDWGDDTGAGDATFSCQTVADVRTFTIEGTHTYAAAGFYHVTGTFDDGNGDTASIAASAVITAAAPTVGAPDVTGVTATAASIGATVNPQGAETSYVVNYGTTTDYGQQTDSFDAGSSTTDQAVSVTLQGLSPSTTYHVQVAATNSAGTTMSSDATFTTTAALLMVNTTSDLAPTEGECSGPPQVPCSLRQAINLADQDASGDTVVLSVGIYGLTLGSSLQVDAPMTISGVGVGSTTIDGSSNLDGQNT